MSADTFLKGKKMEDILKESESKNCRVQRLLYCINEFIRDVMCGKCFPCAFGTEEARIITLKLSQCKEGLTERDIDLLKRIGLNMIEGSFCKKGKDMGGYIFNTVESFYDEIKQHTTAVCPYNECVSIFHYVINPNICIKCGECVKVCKYYAIVSKKEIYGFGSISYEIDQNLCTQCGECINVCPVNAIDFIMNSKNVLEMFGREEG